MICESQQQYRADFVGEGMGDVQVESVGVRRCRSYRRVTKVIADFRRHQVQAAHSVSLSSLLSEKGILAVPAKEG